MKKGRAPNESKIKAKIILRLDSLDHRTSFSLKVHKI